MHKEEEMCQRDNNPTRLKKKKHSQTIFGPSVGSEKLPTPIVCFLLTLKHIY